MVGVCHPDIDQTSYKKMTFKDDIEYGVMYEIWDRETKQRYLVGEGVESDYLTEPRPWPEYLDEFPWLMYWDYAVPGKPRPMSAIAPWEAQLLEKMSLLAQGLNHVKRWNRQMFYKVETIEQEAIERFERGDDGAAIGVRGTGNLAENMKLTDYGQLSVDFYQMMDRLDAISRQTNFQPEFMRGGSTNTKTRTLGELKFIRGGAKSASDRRIDRFETHLENIARHMLAHLEANFDGEEIAKITGDTPQDVLEAFKDHIDVETGTITFKPEDIKGETDVEVKAGSTLPLDEETKREILSAILETIAPAAAQGSVSPFVNALISEILSNFHIKSLEEAFKQEQMLRIGQMKADNRTRKLDEAKVVAETLKRGAQANMIDAETAGMDANMATPGAAAALIATTGGNGGKRAL